VNDDQLSARRIAIIQAIDAAWEKHAQRIVLQVPTGCDSLRQVQGGEVIGRLGFTLAVMGVMETVMGGQVA
jgi:hypothetical protein